MGTHKRLQIGKALLSKRNKARNIVLLNFKIHYNVIVTNHMMPTNTNSLVDNTTDWKDRHKSTHFDPPPFQPEYQEHIIGKE